jgi:proteic killer suppression protein
VKALSGIERPARLKLDRLEAATAVNDLASLPGDRKGQYSIRINDRWRICLEWPDGALGSRRTDRDRDASGGTLGRRT